MHALYDIIEREGLQMMYIKTVLYQESMCVIFNLWSDDI